MGNLLHCKSQQKQHISLKRPKHKRFKIEKVINTLRFYSKSSHCKAVARLSRIERSSNLSEFFFLYKMVVLDMVVHCI